MGARTRAAVLLAATSLCATACGANAQPAAKNAAPATSTPATSAAETTPPSPSETTTPPPPTPEEKINAIAADHGWILDDTSSDDTTDDTPLYDSPAAFVQDMCDSLPDQADSGPAQWLAQSQATTPDEKDILKAGIPLLCPEWTKTVQQAASGRYPVYIDSGTFKVTSKRAEDTVPPGTYRTTGDLSGCYWERTKADGTIIDNNFATAATRITVTILPSLALTGGQHLDAMELPPEKSPALVDSAVAPPRDVDRFGAGGAGGLCREESVLEPRYLPVDARDEEEEVFLCQPR